MTGFLDSAEFLKSAVLLGNASQFIFRNPKYNAKVIQDKINICLNSVVVQLFVLFVTDVSIALVA